MQTQLINEILRYLEKKIQSGIWKPGDRIDTEATLAQRFNASRSSVHYTLQRLAIFGVLESSQGKGIYVKNIPFDLLMERLHSLTRSVTLRKIMEFRIILESEVCRSIAPYISVETLNEMDDCTRLMESLCNRPKQFVRADLQFHRLLLSATNNEVIIRSFDILAEETERQNIEYFNRQGAIKAIAHHKNIVEQLRSRDSEGAKHAMTNHFYETPCDPPFDLSCPLENVLLFSFNQN